MPTQLTGISPTCRPLNANTPAGEPCIALLAKRTYVLDTYGSTGVPAAEQRPLRPLPIHEGDPTGLLLADSEAWPYKLRADVESAVRESRIGFEGAGRMLRFYEDGLGGYTYLEDPNER